MRVARGVAMASLMTVLATVASVPAAAAGSDPRSEGDWILSAQLANGAVASHADRTFVSPYLAAYAAVGLSDATRMTRDPRYAEAAWRSLEWYASVMDPNGYVTDYRIDNGNLVSTGSADSTDAYAGMFLVALDAAYRAAPNLSRLRTIAPSVRAAVSAIRSTQRTDGLTGAKPSYMVAYLMNQAEAFAGLTAANRLRCSHVTPVTQPGGSRLALSNSGTRQLARTTGRHTLTARTKPRIGHSSTPTR